MFQDLVASAKSGDLQAKNEIVVRLQPLLVNLIGRLYNVGGEYEDSMQDGRLMILLCIEEYDRDSGVYFLAFVKSKLKYMYLNKNRDREKTHIRLNEKIGWGEVELLDLLGSEDGCILDRIIGLEGYGDLYRAYEKLNGWEKQVIDLYYIKGKSMKVISKELKTPYRTIVNRKIKALERLRKNI